MTRLKSNLTYNILYWMIAWVFLSWFFTRLTKEYSYTLLFSTLLMLLAIGTTYTFNYYLIPRFLLTKKYVRFILLTLFTGLMSLWLELLGIWAIFLYLLRRFETAGQGLPFFIDPVFLFAGLYFVIIAGVVIHMVRRSFSMQEQHLKLENLRLDMGKRLAEAELNSMKTQFHPHFLFNTLNNLYWLTLTKSDDAPRLVLKISELLDYSLYRCNQDQVPLVQEINYINNYLEIMKIRFPASDGISFIVNGVTADRMIAPLLLIALVENAFKHGFAQVATAAMIRIHLEVDPLSIRFNVLNSIPPDSGTGAITPGLGLTQLQMKLNLLYPNRHELTFNRLEHTFNAQLILHD